jgi:hypothetical protein
MPTQIIIDDDAPILVELRAGRGVVDVARANETEIAQKSALAFNNALETIVSVAKRTASAINSIDMMDPPDSVEMTFGLKLTSEANALIVNAGVEAQIEVKLVWEKKEKQSITVKTDGQQ